MICTRLRCLQDKLQITNYKLQNIVGICVFGQQIQWKGGIIDGTEC